MTVCSDIIPAGIDRTLLWKASTRAATATEVPLLLQGLSDCTLFHDNISVLLLNALEMRVNSLRAFFNF